MSKNTKQVKVMVVSLAVILPSSRVILNTHSVPHIITKADSKIFDIRFLVKICSVSFLGGFFKTSRSTGSKPKLCAEINGIKWNLWDSLWDDPESFDRVFGPVFGVVFGTMFGKMLETMFGTIFGKIFGMIIGTIFLAIVQTSFGKKKRIQEENEESNYYLVVHP